MTEQQNFNKTENDEFDINAPIHPEIENIRRKILLNSISDRSYSSLLKLIPIEDLINEIRSRRLSETLYGCLAVNSNNDVAFSIDKLTWPVGNYKIKITFEEEIPTPTEEVKN